MQGALQVSFQGCPHSDEVERACEREVAKLETFCDALTNGSVVIRQPHHRHHKGDLFEVHVTLHMPGRVVTVNRAPPEHAKSEHIEIALREAFDTARRRLQDEMRLMRGVVKLHAEPEHGRVLRVDREGGFGFIGFPDGRELYFHAHSVLGADFAALVPGDVVTCVEEPGQRGPQAASVQLVGHVQGSQER